MSYIKRLEIDGFKSFAKKTIINFEKNFNTIVGSNGSGKSNIFDSLCFVLGKISSKSLRTEKLGNLVFNGGVGAKGRSSASVSIYLDNKNRQISQINEDEIKISRHIKKTGVSNYFLFDKKVTRTIILEILKKIDVDPQGHNIILQGDIMRIINMSSIERRELIEEICDISGYEEKRESGIRKLDKIELDLKDADLLLDEKTKYLKNLRVEKEQAEAYEEKKNKFEKLSFRYLYSKIKNVENKILKKKENLESKNEIHNDMEKDLEEVNKKIDSLNLEIKKIDEEIEKKSRGKYVEITNSITQLNSDIKFLDEKKSENLKQSFESKNIIKEIENDIKKNENENKLFEKELIGLKKTKNNLEEKILEFTNKINSLKQNIDSKSFDEMDNIQIDIDKLYVEVQNKKEIKQDNSIQIEKLNTKIELLENEINKIQDLENENKDKVTQLNLNRKKIKKLIIEISTLISKNGEMNSKINSLREELRNFESKKTKLDIKVRNLQQQIVSNRAVDFVLKQKKEDRDICGIVSELFSTKSKYSLAFETLLGRNLFSIVCNNDSCATKYLTQLKEKQIGRATFFPINKIKLRISYDEKVLNGVGVVDYMINLINYDSKYEDIMEFLLTDTILIEDISQAKKIGIGKYKMITLNGDIVLKSGAMSGGFNSKRRNTGLIKNEDCDDELNSMNNKISTIENSLNILEEDLKNNEENLSNKREEKIDIETEILELEKFLKIDNSDLSKINVDIKNLISDKQIIVNSKNQIDKEIKIFEDDITNKKNEKNKLKKNTNLSLVTNDINSNEEKKEKIVEEHREIISKISSIEIKLNSIIKKDIIELKKKKDSIIIFISNYEKKNKEFEINKKNKKIELKELEIKEKEFNKQHENTLNRKDDIIEKKEKLLNKHKNKYDKFENIKNQINQITFEINSYDSQLIENKKEFENFCIELKTEFDTRNLDFETWKKEGEIEIKNFDFDLKDLQIRINKLKIKLSSFGTINLKAVELYDKIKIEFDILLEKREKLNVEKKAILDFIEEIDKLKKNKFMETFTELKKKFIEIYSKISTKGKVELNLEDENNIFENGIEIRVRLSQKNYLDIKALSGGEKTITAVAFIFAIQEFKPAPFYILDEIDAALDILNCEKLGEFVKEYSKKSQYIVISHSEHFIQSSKIIFGVSMKPDKTSFVLSLDLKKAKEYVDVE